MTPYEAKKSPNKQDFRNKFVVGFTMLPRNSQELSKMNQHITECITQLFPTCICFHDKILIWNLSQEFHENRIRDKIVAKILENTEYTINNSDLHPLNIHAYFDYYDTLCILLSNPVVKWAIKNTSRDSKLEIGSISSKTIAISLMNKILKDDDHAVQNGPWPYGHVAAAAPTINNHNGHTLDLSIKNIIKKMLKMNFNYINKLRERYLSSLEKLSLPDAHINELKSYFPGKDLEWQHMKSSFSYLSGNLILLYLIVYFE